MGKTLEDKVKDYPKTIAELRDRIKDKKDKLTDAKKTTDQDKINKIESQVKKSEKDLEVAELKFKRDKDHLENKQMIDKANEE